MALKEHINNDLKAALLGGDRFAGETLRGLKAAILNEEVAKGVREAGLDDTSIEQLVVREIKKRNESATLYEQHGRAESAEDERKEAAILSKYLPEQLSDEQVVAVIREVVAELGVSGPAAMGQVIGAVKAKLGTSADGATIARLVKIILSE